MQFFVTRENVQIPLWTVPQHSCNVCRHALCCQSKVAFDHYYMLGYQQVCSCRCRCSMTGRLHQDAPASGCVQKNKNAICVDLKPSQRLCQSMPWLAIRSCHTPNHCGGRLWAQIIGAALPETVISAPNRLIHDVSLDVNLDVTGSGKREAPQFRRSVDLQKRLKFCVHGEETGVAFEHLVDHSRRIGN